MDSLSPDQLFEVTKIVPVDQKKSKIYIDDALFCVLYSGEMRRLHIHEGAVLTDELLNQIMEKIIKPRARAYVMHMIETREQTRHQIREKLHQHFYPDDAIDYAIGFWEERGYIDDKNYALRFVENYYSRLSRKKIDMKLLQRGILPDHIEGAWQCVGLESDDVSQAQQLAFDSTFVKLSRHIDTKDPKQKQRLIRQLLYRGFAYNDIINKIGT